MASTIATTEKPCTKCEATKPLDAFSLDRRNKAHGRQTICRACAQDVRRRNYLANRERLIAKARSYRKENPEKRQAVRRAYYLAHREEELARQRAAYEADPAKHIAAVQRSGRANIERRRAAGRKASTRYRAQKMAVPCEEVDTEFVLFRDAGICGICEHPVDPTNWHLDHIYPLSRGGHHTYANVQVAHPDCNIRKGARVPDVV